MHSARQLGPLAVHAESVSSAIETLVSALRERAGVCVAFANTHLLYHAIKDPTLAGALKRFMLLNDGVGVALLAQLSCGRGFPENLNGTDFTPRLLAAAPAGCRLYLYGGRKDVNAAAAQTLARHYKQLEVCGFRDGHSGRQGETQVVTEMHAAAPDLVLVALGNPLQEAFIARTAPHFPQASFIGVGAFFDFLTATAPRAPTWMRMLKLEWLFRLAREPARLWRRYTVEVLVVALALLATRVGAGNFSRAR